MNINGKLYAWALIASASFGATLALVGLWAWHHFHLVRYVPECFK